MLFMYTNRHIPKGAELVFDVESEYSIQILKHWSRLKNDKVIIEIHRSIDHTTIVSNGSIYTRFGLCTPHDFSTGTKAAILAYYYRNQPNILVNIAECGANVIRLMATFNFDLYTFNSSYTTFGFYDEKIVLNGDTVTIREATRRITHEKHE